MESKAPALLVILVEAARLRWFVACIGLDGQTIPLICSEADDLAKIRGVEFDEQVGFLRHRFCGALQRGCDRLWARNLKACHFVFVFEGLLEEPTGELIPAVARHLAGAKEIERQELFLLNRLAGSHEAPLEELLRAHLGELLAAKDDSAAWEQVRKNGVWCVQKDKSESET
jgi:hypothetical protein